MIYLLLFTYLFILMIVYDVCGKIKYRQIHFIMALFLMIMTAGLRYRLGTDTIAYLSDFPYYPYITQLKASDFADYIYQPLWIILNSLCRSLGDFTYVQLFTSAIHIGIYGYAFKKLCPSLLFSSLFLYYIYDFINLNMEVMREALALSFFLLAVLALNRHHIVRMILYAVVATLFHIFALPVFIIFILYYIFLSKRPILGILLMTLLLGIVAVNRDFMMTTLLNYVVDGNGIELAETAITYANNDDFATNNLNLTGKIIALSQPFFLLAMFFWIRPYYSNYCNLSWRIFSTTIWISILLCFCIYSMPIIRRVYHYFHFFTTILMVVFIMSQTFRLKRQQIIPIYATIMTFLSIFALQHYFVYDPFTGTERWYSCYYPYSSTFDQTIDKHRENILNHKGHY